MSRSEKRAASGLIRNTGSYDVVVASRLGAVAFIARQAPVSVPPEPEAFAAADASFSESRWLDSQLPYEVGPDGRAKPPVIKNSRARATFSAEAIKALPAGDLDVVIVTADGERRCSVQARQRVRLFP
jgi:hypothetical protein